MQNYLKISEVGFHGGKNMVLPPVKPNESLTTTPQGCKCAKTNLYDRTAGESENTMEYAG